METLNFDNFYLAPNHFQGHLPSINCLENLLKSKNNYEVRTNKNIPIDSSSDVSKILNVNYDNPANQIFQNCIGNWKRNEQSINELIDSIHLLNSYNLQYSDLFLLNQPNFSDFNNTLENLVPSFNQNCSGSEIDKNVSRTSDELISILNKTPLDIVPSMYSTTNNQIENANEFFTTSESCLYNATNIFGKSKSQNTPIESDIAADLYRLLSLPFNFDNKNALDLLIKTELPEYEQLKYDVSAPQQNQMDPRLVDTFQNSQPDNKNKSTLQILPKKIEDKSNLLKICNTKKKPKKKSIRNELANLDQQHLIGSQSTDIFSTILQTGSVNQIPKKHKKQRILFQRSTVQILEKKFKANQYLSNQERNQLATTLDMTPNQVKIWFQNKRYKIKKNL